MGKSKKGRGSKNKRTDPLRGVTKPQNGANGHANGDEVTADKAGLLDRVTKQLQSSKSQTFHPL